MTIQNIYESLGEIAVYKQYPDLMPYFGPKWLEEEKPRLLFIAESHYTGLDNSVTSNQDFSNFWYESSYNDFATKFLEPNSEYGGYFNTRSIIGNFIKNDKPGRVLGAVVGSIVRESCQNKTKEEFFNNVCWYNYFQRPSIELGKSIKLTAQDIEVAYSTFAQLYRILKPTSIIVTSKKASDKLWHALVNDKQEKLTEQEREYCKRNFVSLVHPGTSWWNRKRKGETITSREKLREFLKSIQY